MYVIIYRKLNEQNWTIAEQGQIFGDFTNAKHVASNYPMSLEVKVMALTERQPTAAQPYMHTRLHA